jgi:hypothetical protein
MNASFQDGGALGQQPGKTDDAPLPFGILAQVRAYWEALRVDGALPQRSQIDPRGIDAALTGALLCEQVAPGIARFRIAGSCFNDLAGMDVRGMPLSALFAPMARDPLSQALTQVFALPARLELTLEAERGIGRPALQARLLLLPLRDGRGACTLALGCLALSGKIGHRPRRFHITNRLVSPIMADRREAAPLPATGFAEVAPGFIPPRAKPGSPHLRLVATNR